MQRPIDMIPICETDSEGVFKYIQISCNNKIYIRGYASCKYHKGIYKEFQKELENHGATGFITKVLGGGRINISPTEKTIKVYGYSHAYGRCKHQKTCDLLKEKYPDYEITWTNEGY